MERGDSLTKEGGVAMTRKKTKKQLIQKILQSLSKDPQTINEIAENAGSNWDTISQNLGILKELGIVEELNDNHKKIFKLKKNEIIYRDDTLFGLPINNTAENLCNYLFVRIKKKWQEKKQFELNKTQMQKVVAEIAENVNDFSIIPRGWYLFGEMCILQYDPAKEYKHKIIKEEASWGAEIDRAIDIYAKYEHTPELLFEQYSRRNKELYLHKLNLQRALYSRIDADTKKLISQLLYGFAIKFPSKTDNKDIVQMLNMYVSITNQILLEKPEAEIAELQPQLIDCFIAVWELIAMYNLLDSLAEGNFGYTRDMLWKYFKDRSEVSKIECIEYLSELNSYISPKVFEKDSKLYKLMGSVKPRELSEEEKNKLFADYESKDTSDIFRKLNLD